MTLLLDHQTHIRRLVVSRVEAGVDPFDHMADFAPPSEVEQLREQVACLEASRRRALEHLAPVKKATKDVLLGKIECARDELARVMVISQVGIQGGMAVKSVMENVGVDREGRRWYWLSHWVNSGDDSSPIVDSDWREIKEADDAPKTE